MAWQMKDSGIAWIGEIPEEWEVIKAKFILSANDGGVWGNDPADDGTDRIVIRSTEQTIDGKWCIDAPAVRDLSAIPHASSRILPGDLLITKSSGSDLHIGKTTLADDYFERNECYFSNFIQRIRCKDYLPKLLWYLFNSNIVREQFVYLQNTTSGIGNINADIIDNLFLPNPPLDMQQRIADFLDRRCAEIDAVIERTRATIEEYKKLKQAVITEAVTKGVRGPRKMKDSGIEWIGEIPEEWTTVQLKRLAKISTGNTPPKNEDGGFYSQDSGCLWIKAEDLGTSNSIEITAEYLTDAGKQEGRVFPPCTVYVCCIASVGKVGFCLTEASCNQQINGLVFENAHWKFGYYLSIAQEEEYLINASGNVMKILNTEKQSRLMCPCPPIEEQIEIARNLDEKCTTLDTLIAKKTALLTELESYKKSLIYEYVTGKKEVV